MLKTQLLRDKSTHFFRQSVFGQLISLIDNRIISEASLACKSDHYVKRFTTNVLLVSTLFNSFAKCTSLREVSGAMLGLSGKTKLSQPQHIHKRSMLSNANKQRDSSVFGSIYNRLLRKYGPLISDSRIKDNAVYEIIEVTVKEGSVESKLKLHKIRFYDRVLKWAYFQNSHE